MTVRAVPLTIGCLMGLIMPWMMHMGGGEFGMTFLLAHLVIVLAAASTALVFPALRRKVAHLASHATHAPWMVAGLAFSWGVTCLYCLTIGGLHWT